MQKNSIEYSNIQCVFIHIVVPGSKKVMMFSDFSIFIFHHNYFLAYYETLTPKSILGSNTPFIKKNTHSYILHIKQEVERIEQPHLAIDSTNRT